MVGNRCNVHESDDGQRDEGWRRPRNADSETVSYLREVEEELKRINRESEDQTQAQTNEGGIPTPKYLLIDNVLAELRYSTASLMCDKDSSVVLEQLLYASAPNPNKAIALMLSRCEPYFLCLATNRFASHVLQTLLDLSGPAILREIEAPDKLNDCFEIDRKGSKQHSTAGESGADEEHIPVVWETVLSLAGCARGNWLALARHYSGSHVGRALIRALTGCQMSRVDERGCNRQFPPPPQRAAVDGIIGKWGEQSSSFPRLPVPEDFKSAMSEVCEEIAAWRSVDLQRLTCSASGGPLLITTLAACASSSGEVDGEQPFCLSQDTPAMKVIESALEWGKGKNVYRNVVYGMAGEPVGSHFLEAMIWLAPLNFLQKFHLWCLAGELCEYCVDGNANFVVQAILRRLANEESENTTAGVNGEVNEQEVRASSPSCEEDHHSIIGSNSTSRDVVLQLAKSLLEELLWPAEGSSFESEFLSSVPSGVLWAVAELARRLLPDLQGPVRDAIGCIYTGNRPSLPGPVQKGTSSSVHREAFTEARSWLPKLLAPCLLKDDDGESTDLNTNGGIEGQYRPTPVHRRRPISINVPGAQAIRSMLRFSRINEAAPVAAAISALPQEVLVAAAKDSTAGRCVIDPVLALEDKKLGGGKLEYWKVFRDAKLAISRAFKLNCFSVVPMEIKCNMVDELCGKGGSVKDDGWSNSAKRLKALSSSAPSGMTVVQKLQLERYSRDKKGWKEAILRHGQKAEAFEVAFGKGTTADTAKSGNHSESAASPAVAQMKKKARHRKNVDDGQIGRANEGGGDGDRVIVCKKAKRNKKDQQTAEIERETALDQLLAGMGGRTRLFSDALSSQKDSVSRKTTERETTVFGRKPNRIKSKQRNRRQVIAVEDVDSKVIVKVKTQEEDDDKLHNGKHDEGNKIDGAVNVKGSTLTTRSLPSEKTKHKKKTNNVSHENFRLFK